MGKCPEVPDMLNSRLRLRTRTALFQKANLSPKERKGQSKVAHRA